MNTSICISINTKFVHHNRDTTVRMRLKFRLQSSNGCALMEIKRKKTWGMQTVFVLVL